MTDSPALTDARAALRKALTDAADMTTREPHKYDAYEALAHARRIKNAADTVVSLEFEADWPRAGK